MGSLLNQTGKASFNGGGGGGVVKGVFNYVSLCVKLVVVW